MNSFDSKQLDALPASLLWLHGKAMEYRGKQALYEKQRPETLKTLREMALIQSAESSNRIEGVTVDADRLKPLVLGTTKPRERPEEEVVGYRKALSWIHEKHAKIELDTKTILNLHKLAQGGFSDDAGQWKSTNNDIIEISPSGERSVRFKPATADQTPKMMEQLCLSYHRCLNQSTLPPLLAAANFVFDFLCIHPFRDGNGRVSRLLSLLCLYQHDFRVGCYISLERIIEETKESYYDVLQRSSANWHDGNHDLVPWLSYFLSTLNMAYREFEERVTMMEKGYGAKGDLVESAIESLPRSFSFAELAVLCPSVGKDRIRQILRKMREEKKIDYATKGRNAKWCKTKS